MWQGRRHREVLAIAPEGVLDPGLLRLWIDHESLPPKPITDIRVLTQQRALVSFLDIGIWLPVVANRV